MDVDAYAPSKAEPKQDDNRTHQQRANDYAREHSDVVHNSRAVMVERRARLMAEVEDIDFALQTIDPLCKTAESLLDRPTTEIASRPY